MTNIHTLIESRIHLNRVPALPIPIRQLADKPVHVDGTVSQPADGRVDSRRFTQKSPGKTVYRSFFVGYSHVVQLMRTAYSSLVTVFIKCCLLCLLNFFLSLVFKPNVVKCYN